MSLVDSRQPTPDNAVLTRPLGPQSMRVCIRLKGRDQKDPRLLGAVADVSVFANTVVVKRPQDSFPRPLQRRSPSLPRYVTTKRPTQRSGLASGLRMTQTPTIANHGLSSVRRAATDRTKSLTSFLRYVPAFVARSTPPYSCPPNSYSLGFVTRSASLEHHQQRRCSVVEFLD